MVVYSWPSGNMFFSYDKALANMKLAAKGFRDAANILQSGVGCITHNHALA